MENEEEEGNSFFQSEKVSLNMSESFYRRSNEEKKQKRYLLFALFIAALVFIEYEGREYLKIASNYLFSSNDPSRCKYFSYFDFFTYCGNYFLIFFVYHYVNIYAALCISFLDSFCVALIDILQFIYLEPRPFWENPNVFPCYCATDYANPSMNAFNLIILFTSFYYALTFKSNNTSKKIILILICTICVLWFYIARLIESTVYLHQVFFGFALGIGIYCFVFNIVCIDFYSRKQFKAIINHSILISILTIVLWGVVNTYHMSIQLKDVHMYITNIQEHCEINNFFSFNTESFRKSIQVADAYGSYLGVLFEYWFTFEGNFDMFCKYNIDKPNLFNATKGEKSFIRLLLFYFLQFLLFKRFIFRKAFKGGKEHIPILLIITRFFLPMLFQGIFFFYIMKRVIVWINLTNEKNGSLVAKIDREEQIELKKANERIFTE